MWNSPVARVGHGEQEEISRAREQERTNPHLLCKDLGREGRMTRFPAGETGSCCRRGRSGGKEVQETGIAVSPSRT